MAKKQRAEQNWAAQICNAQNAQTPQFYCIEQLYFK